MALGGKRPGAGRKLGSTVRPQLRDYFTQQELVDFFNDLKESAKTDPMIKKFVAEQLLGKAVQPIGNDGDEPFKVQGIDITIRK